MLTIRKRLGLTRLSCFLAAGLMSSSCGKEDAPVQSDFVSIDVTGTFLSPLLSCQLQTQAGLQAVYIVGGQVDRPCTLSIDPGTLRATGLCERITVGIARPTILIAPAVPEL